MKIGRKDFIRAIAAALASAAIGPGRVWGQGLKTAISDYGIVDLHCHPSLKMYLWNKKIWKKGHPSAGGNFIEMQETVDELSRGYVKGLLVAHYLVEADLTKESAVLKNLLPWIKRVFPGLADKIEHKDWSNFTQINVMIDTMETQVHLANLKQNQVQFVLARDYSEFTQALSQSKIPIAHAVEGLTRSVAIYQPRMRTCEISKH